MTIETRHDVVVYDNEGMWGWWMNWSWWSEMWPRREEVRVMVLIDSVKFVTVGPHFSSSLVLQIDFDCTFHDFTDSTRCQTLLIFTQIETLLLLLHPHQNHHQNIIHQIFTTATLQLHSFPIIHQTINSMEPLLSPHPLLISLIPFSSVLSIFISLIFHLTNWYILSFPWHSQGTGMLAMAHGFAAGGLLLGFSTVLICGGMAYFGLSLLSLCAAHPAVPHRASSFFAIASVTYPRGAWVFDLAIAIKCFGVSISYLLIFGRLMPQVHFLSLTHSLFLSLLAFISISHHLFFSSSS